MNIIIDGYNLLYVAKTIIPTITEQEIIKTAQQYHLLRSHHITIVFDGGISPYQQEEYRRDLTIIFAGAYQSADDVIIQLAKTKKSTQAHLLVSNDQKLREEVQKEGIIPIDSELFFTIMMQRIKNNKQMKTKKSHAIITKYSTQYDPITDPLMHKLFDIEKEPLIEEHASLFENNKKQLSKKEKRIAAILEKL